MSERLHKRMSSLRRHDMQEVKIGCHPIAEGNCPIGSVHALNSVVEMNVYSLPRCDFEERIAELLAWREHHRSGSVEMDVRLNAF